MMTLDEAGLDFTALVEFRDWLDAELLRSSHEANRALATGEYREYMELRQRVNALWETSLKLLRVRNDTLTRFAETI